MMDFISKKCNILEKEFKQTKIVWILSQNGPGS
jgi:hypothetical protein